MNELLKQLTDAVGVSGDEVEIRTLIRDLIVDHVDEWHADALGNILAVKKGTGASDLRVMVDAHMDEVGIIIDEIRSDGMLRFSNIGGLSSLTLAGQVMQIGRKKVRGVIGLKPVHLLSKRERHTIPSAGSLYIDIGAKDKAAAASKIKVGDRGTFWSEYVEFGDVAGDFGRSAIAKAFDNRAACAALIELLRGDPFPFDLHAAFTCQEEVGLRGAKVAAYAIKPDVGIVLECTPAYDLPNKLDRGSNTSLGQGPALYVMDSQTIQDPRLVRHIMQTGDANKIPYQIRRPGGGGTNTGNIQRADLGCSAATIGLPGRYAHTAATLINLRDYANYVKLADAALRSLTQETIKRG
ncbi:MAG: M42 family metallopeptidase [Candidatus Promineifilaceae bacterium]